MLDIDIQQNIDNYIAKYIIHPIQQAIVFIYIFGRGTLE
jgi:hypothetical protein